jgi:hypothetical protein
MEIMDGWIWLKVLKFIRSFIKGRGAKIFSKFRRPPRLSGPLTNFRASLLIEWQI